MICTQCKRGDLLERDFSKILRNGKTLISQPCKWCKALSERVRYERSRGQYGPRVRTEYMRLYMRRRRDKRGSAKCRGDTSQ